MKWPIFIVFAVTAINSLGAVNYTNKVPNLAVATNATVGGYLSISGQTNRLTVASGELKLDGTTIGSGGSSPWTNVSGVIKPAPGQTTNVLQFASGLEGNATNVAMVVDTANPWTDGDFVRLRNSGTNVWRVGAINGDSTRETIETQVSSTNWAQIITEVSNAGAGSGGRGTFKISQSDDDYTDNDTYAQLKAWGAGTGQQLQLYATYDGYTTERTVTLNNNPSYLTIAVTGPGVVTALRPEIASGTTPYVFGTTSSHSSGNLLETKNNSTNKFAVSWDGAPVTQGGSASTPSAANATGTAGEIRWDSGFIYVCVAANTWKRVAIATW